MNANITVYAFCLVLVIAGSSFWSYTMKIDDAEKERVLAVQQLAAAEQGVKQAKAWLAARREALALMTAAGILEQKNDVLRAEVAIQRQKRLEIAKNFISAIERGRSDFLGTLIHDITLANGAHLRQARLQAADSETAVLVHSGGISKVSTALLPEVVLDRFRFGYLPAGVGSSPLEPSTPSRKTIDYTLAPRSTKLATTASDSLARLGMDANVAAIQKNKKTKAAVPQSDPQRIKTEGDAALWKSVQRTSIGRAYIPGQGWLKIGEDGPIPGTGRR
jgi:hypothetical protein